MSKNYLSSLSNNHPLFETLKRDNPLWWQYVKDNIKPSGFYVDIRKDNSLNIYYNGGSLLKIKWSYGKISCKIHAYYLGETGSGYITYDPERVPYEADEIKKKIASRYSNTSENGIKARLICAHGATFIDSEFAYSEPRSGGYLTTRIDMVKIEDEKIVFVELKRIQDGRLLTNEYEQGRPEILTQMGLYHDFINKHKEEITGYYRKLYDIKRELGILPKSLASVENIDNYELCDNVELFIESYDYLTPKRTRRVNAIREILDNNSITHNL